MLELNRGKSTYRTGAKRREEEALMLFFRACPAHLPVSATQLGSRRHCCTVFGPQQERPRDKSQRSHFYCTELV